jgi:ABC-type cobalamin transport system ATPase subunit
MIRSTTILTAADVDRLSQLYLFREVPRAALESLALSAITVRFAEGDTVFQQGTPADVALLLAEGRLTHHGPCADPASHRALEQVFDHRIAIHALQGQWVALPTQRNPHAD